MNDTQHHEHRSVGGGVYAMLVFGILLVVGGVVLPILNLEVKIGLGAVFAMIAFGLVLSLLSTALLVVAKLYVRTKASEAFVKTGKGGMVVIQNGGAIVIPMIHEILRVSRLDQTDPTTLKNDNIFDAQGLRTIAEITQKARTERNLLERAGEQEREKQNVETTQRLLALQQQQAEAQAKQSAEIAGIKAAQDRAAKEKEIERDRAVAVATQQKDQAVQIATQQKEQAVQVATQQKDKAVQIAVQDRERAVEVAMREKQAAIADAEKAKAMKEAEKNKAEAEREKEAQAIQTVQAQAQAERQKAVEVTQDEAEAQKKKVEAEQTADAAAYTIQKQAEGQKAAAEAQAAATRQNVEAAAAAKIAQATADATAIKNTAEAEAAAQFVGAEAQAKGKMAVVQATRAEAMIPVEVNAAQVDVEKKRVEVRAAEVAVLQQEMEARAAHGGAAQDFELAKLRIIKEAEIRISSANAMASIQGKIEATVVSTVEDVARLNQRMMQGMGIANGIGGFMQSIDDKFLDGAGELADLARALLHRVTKGKEGTPAGGNGGA